jgi:hypothetical protein
MLKNGRNLISQNYFIGNFGQIFLKQKNINEKY